MPDTPVATDRLLVDADLAVTVEARGRTARAHVAGTGRELSVTVDHPDVLAADRAMVGRLADLLAAAGLTASVHGPGGTIARLGAGTSSRLGARFTGSTYAALAPRGAWLLFRTTVGPAAGLTAAAVLTAVAVRLLLRDHPREQRA